MAEKKRWFFAGRGNWGLVQALQKILLQKKLNSQQVSLTGTSSGDGLASALLPTRCVLNRELCRFVFPRAPSFPLVGA